MSALSELLGLPDGFDPSEFQRAYARTASDWALAGRGVDLEKGSPEFWEDVRRDVPAPRSPKSSIGGGSDRGGDVSRLTKTLKTYASVFGEASEDLRRSRAGEQILYNLDFSLLAPYLFDRPSKGSADFLLAPLGATKRIIEADESDRNFQLVISPLTALEVFDQIEHELHAVGERQPWLYSAVDDAVMRESLMTDAGLRAELLRYTKKGLRANLEEPLQRMRDLIDRGVLRGFAEVVDDVDDLRREYRTHGNVWEAFYAEHRRARLGRESKRQVIDSEFHYKIDAMNSALTLATARLDGPTALFVTPTILNRRQCVMQSESFARWDRTPLVSLNAVALVDAGVINSEVDFTDQLAKDAAVYASWLEKVDDLGSVSPWVRQKISKFIADDIGLVADAARFELDENIVGDVEEVMSTLVDTSAMKAAIQESVEQVREDARELSEDLGPLGFDYLDDFDLDDDPVLQRIQEQLGIASRSRTRR